ncbi:MAG: pitrilysin family protein [Gemmataceae bacterium]
MPFHIHKLQNGLTVIGESSPSARSVAVGFFVKTGSRDETPEVAGVSHFLEHMAFKGSDRRTAFDVNRDFDRIGADYNASTSEENTIYHAAVLPEYLPQVVDILSDLLTPKLRQDDFDMEKQVIINEIGRYEDMPGWSAYDHAQRVYFRDHRLGNSVLGTTESITALQRDQMERYFRSRYVGPNITLAVAGAIDWPAFVALAERQCGGWPGTPAPRGGQRETTGTGAVEVVCKDKVAQEYVVMLSPGPAASSPLRHAADLLGMAVGDDSGSRLYWELVDPGLAESASCYFREYEDTGAFYTSLTCDREQVDENVAIACRVLAEVQRDGLRPDELEQARNKLLSRVVRSGERPKGRMFSLGSAWTYYGEYRSIDDELADYERVTLADVRAVLDRYPLDRLTTVALGPLREVRVPSRN